MRERLRRGEIDDLQKPESWTERYRELDKQFDALVQKQRETIVKDQLDQIYTKNGGEFLNAFTSEDQTAYFLPHPEEQAGALGVARVRPPAEPRLPRVLLGAGRGLRGAAARRRVDAARQVRRGVQRPLLGGEPLQVAGGGLGLRHPDVHPRPGEAVLRHLLRPQQPHRRPRRRLQVRRRQAAPRALLRAHPPGDGRAAPGRDPGAEAARGEALQRRGRDLPHRADLVEDGAPPPQGHPRPRPPLRRPLRPHGPALQGPRARPAGGERSPRPRSTPRKYAGIFMVETTVKDGKEPAAAEAAVYEEIEKLQKEEVPAEELQKVKNAYKANAYRRLSSPFVRRVPARELRRARRLAAHQHLARARRRRDRGRPPAGGAGVPDEGEPHGRHLPPQGGGGAGGPGDREAPAAGADHGPPGRRSRSRARRTRRSCRRWWGRCSRWPPRCRRR